MNDNRKFAVVYTSTKEVYEHNGTPIEHLTQQQAQDFAKDVVAAGIAQVEVKQQ